jgi:TolA-binding protein
LLYNHIQSLASRNSDGSSFSFFLDLQFALAYQTASADTEAELRSLITGLHVESDSSKELVLSLQAELEKSQQKVIELEEQLRWQELEKQNQLNIKEAKIQELIRGLNISSSDPKV